MNPYEPPQELPPAPDGPDESNAPLYSVIAVLSATLVGLPLVIELLINLF